MIKKLSYILIAVAIVSVIASGGLATAATRFYLPSTGTADISTSTASTWEVTDVSFTRREMSPTKLSSAVEEQQLTEDIVNSADQDWLFRQYVSNPIAAQTISAQQVKLQIRGNESASGNNMAVSWLVKIVSNNGGTLRGTLVGHRRDNLELAVSVSEPLTYTNRGDNVTSTAVTAEDGDRIILEIGTGGNPAVSAGHASGLVFNDDNATDLGENNTDTAAFNPWLQFQNDITFQTVSATPEEEPQVIIIDDD